MKRLRDLARAAGGHHDDEAGQRIGGRPEAVPGPRAHARPAADGRARVHARENVRDLAEALRVSGRGWDH